MENLKQQKHYKFNQKLKTKNYLKIQDEVEISELVTDISENLDLKNPDIKHPNYHYKSNYPNIDILYISYSKGWS